VTTAPYRRVLTGWDASPAAHAALTHAAAIVGPDGIVIARAVLTAPSHTETSGEERRALAAQRDRLQGAFDTARPAATASGTRARLEWGEADPTPGAIAADLAAHAEEHGCDLLVLARHGDDTHLRAHRLGPVAESVLHGTALPVLLVSP
jgi:nucleotide-binding universal stress UspA family protein